jgi:glycosyltransferase involved in cell wall biosynthesis
MPQVSVVVPLFDEEETLPHLVRAVRSALDGKLEWELILVDDGSRDRTGLLAESESRRDPRVRAIRLARNYGQASALQAGFDHARHPVVVSMDGDLQNDPRDIPKLVRKLEEGFDLVTGYRQHRQDPLFTRRLPSAMANGLIRLLTGVPIRDTGCALKAYRRELVRRMQLYSDFHRFIPAVAAATAGARIAEVPVQHHPRRLGRSKYGLKRTLQVLADLVVVRTVGSFRNRPFPLFATIATMPLAVGVGFALASLGNLSTPAEGTAGALIFPGVAAIMIGLTVYLLMLGLLAEVAAERWGRDRSPTLPSAS